MVWSHEISDQEKLKDVIKTFAELKMRKKQFVVILA